MNKFFVLFTVFALMACKGDLTKPSPFIEEKQMEDILYDMALLYSIESVSAYTREDTLKKLDVNSIYKKYDIDSLTFVTNNRYYVELEEGIYYKIQNNILARLEANKVVADSLFKKLEGDKEEVSLEAVELKVNDTLQSVVKKIDSVRIQKK